MRKKNKPNGTEIEVKLLTYSLLPRTHKHSDSNTNTYYTCIGHVWWAASCSSGDAVGGIDI